MALVFKIKFQDTLRRWVVSEDLKSANLYLTLSQLEDKIRELFSLSHTTSLLVTYVDKDNDVVTLGDDQDLVDACVLQQLNPLRLDVRKQPIVQEPTTESLVSSTDDGNTDSALKTFPPDTIDGGIQNVVRTSTQGLDVKQSSGFLFKNCKNLAGSVLPHTPALPNHRTDNVYYIFHRGVQCDGCGMNPIEGPRYKSKKIPNYDLCCSCFDLMGTNTFFQKLDYPETSPQRSRGDFSFLKRASRPLRPFYRPECPFSGQAMEFLPLNECCRKFDARFVEDVTVLDGTELEPGTKFTKTWRMQNNGTLPWPQGTQLAHIGGNPLSSMRVLNLELPEGGLPCGRDVDVSVNLTAPNNVGRYVSHWRLILPSGQLFGHTVWVVIQVESLLGKSNKEVYHCQGAGIESPQEEAFSSPCMLKGSVNNSVALPEEEKRSPVLETETDIELDGFSVVEKPLESNQVVSVEKEFLETNLDNQLKLLETMGFENRESNLFWLKKNHTSMENTVKDLLTDAGWEAKVTNLEEMGFNDQTTNIQLLHKHNGSIKLVVKDLVKIENEANGKDALQVTVA